MKDSSSISNSRLIQAILALDANAGTKDRDELSEALGASQLLFEGLCRDRIRGRIARSSDRSNA